MILIEKTEVVGLEATIRGMRNPMNSWDLSDSLYCGGGYEVCLFVKTQCNNCSAKDKCNSIYDEHHIGPNDRDLMMRLAKGGPVHAKYRRMITVYMDVTAPLYWWKEFDTYKVGTVANSCSTMHKIHEKEFMPDDFSHEYLNERSIMILDMIIDELNFNRHAFLNRDNKKYWWQMIQLLPSSYNQKRTIMLNYEVLAGIYKHRREHKLNEWREFCKWIEDLPYSEIITCKIKEKV